MTIRTNGEMPIMTSPVIAESMGVYISVLFKLLFYGPSLTNLVEGPLFQKIIIIIFGSLQVGINKNNQSKKSIK
jgi:hypothetical protein